MNTMKYGSFGYQAQQALDFAEKHYGANDEPSKTTHPVSAQAAMDFAHKNEVFPIFENVMLYTRESMALRSGIDGVDLEFIDADHWLNSAPFFVSAGCEWRVPIHTVQDVVALGEKHRIYVIHELIDHILEFIKEGRFGGIYGASSVQALAENTLFDIPSDIDFTISPYWECDASYEWQPLSEAEVISRFPELTTADRAVSASLMRAKARN